MRRAGDGDHSMFSIGVIAAWSSRSARACRAVRVTCYFICSLPPFTGFRLGRSLFFFGFAARTSVMFIGLSSAVSGYLARSFFADGFVHAACRESRPAGTAQGPRERLSMVLK